MTPITVADLAAQIGGVVTNGDPQRAVTGVNIPSRAGSTDLIFISSAKHQGALSESRAGAVLLSEALDVPDGMAAIRVTDALLAMARAIDVLVPLTRAAAGVSDRALIGDHVEIAPSASIGPGVVIGDRTRIGERTEIRAGVSVGADVVVGDDCVFYSGVRIYDDVRIGNRVILHAGSVVGADGFGYVPEPTPDSAASGEPFRYRKIRQVGTVVIEDDVEVGANSTIDRAMLNETRIGRGTKIDNLVMIGHNSVIGRHNVIVGQAGLSGSVECGNYVTIAGQAGILGHVHVGDRAVIGSQAGVMVDVPAGTSVLGAPALDVKKAYKAYPLIAHLPDLRRLLRTLERRVSTLERDRSSDLK